MPTSSLLAVFIFSFLTGFGAVVSPGPVTTAIISQAPRRGWVVGPLIATGHSVMELAIVVLIGFGLTTGLANPNAISMISILGGLLLFWMGGGMLDGIRKGKIHLPGADVDAEEISPKRLMILGIVTTLSNPFWYAWWITVAAGYLAEAQALGIASIATFFLGHISADYVWDTLLSTIIGSGKNWINDSVYKGIIIFCGLFFIYLGGMFMIQGGKII